MNCWKRPSIQLVLTEAGRLFQENSGQGEDAEFAWKSFDLEAQSSLLRKGAELLPQAENNLLTILQEGRTPCPGGWRIAGVTVTPCSSASQLLGAGEARALPPQGMIII